MKKPMVMSAADVDPQRAVAIQSIDDEAEERGDHEEDRRRRAAASEVLCPTSSRTRIVPGTAGPFEERPGDARLLKARSPSPFADKSESNPHAVAHEIDEGIRKRDGPEKTVVEHMLQEDLAGR